MGPSGNGHVAVFRGSFISLVRASLLPARAPRASAVPHCLKLSKARQRRAGHRLTRQSASPLRTHLAEARTPTQRLRPDFTPGSGTPRPDPLRQDGQRWLLLLGRTHRNYSNQLPRPPPRLLAPACPAPSTETTERFAATLPPPPPGPPRGSPLSPPQHDVSPSFGNCA